MKSEKFATAIHEARDEQSAEERVKQTGETYLQMLWVYAPTSNNSVAHHVGTFCQQSEEDYLHTEHHCEHGKHADTACQQLGIEPTDNEWRYA